MYKAYAQSTFAGSAGSLAQRLGLVSESDRLVDRLREVLGRVDHVGAVLHGPRPSEAAKDRADESSSIRSSVERAHGMMNAIDDALTGIDRSFSPDSSFSRLTSSCKRATL